DVLLGQHMPGTDPAHRSLFAGPHAGIDGTPWFVSWNEQQNGGGIRTPVQDPELLAQTIFGTVSREVRERQTRNRHVFEPVLADINELRG
ncbi:hypothetical protein SB717_36235, partial [Priestia sp. SIMBA_032]|uniref:hypothetical protein n=1 Tax=Priestia sp. SIMBA_032 TaxID=3085775 RepID=UPI00397B933D